ncbi:MAG: hypothetical protein ACYS7Y_04110 [Planctomycetota bacterium]|jgi:hypothetical protein
MQTISRNEINRLSRKMNHLRFHVGVPTDKITVDSTYSEIAAILAEHGTPRLVAQIRQALRQGEI